MAQDTTRQQHIENKTNQGAHITPLSSVSRSNNSSKHFTYNDLFHPRKGPIIPISQRQRNYGTEWLNISR